ncbi:aminotransferase class V-fold PLP-dependent enzyme [Halanaerobiaceae bacterium Z-7014]|uniref:L-methionine gamma-lyase n=1 Tax=Halonatronomonas betaini TaxID=2778430 RepID=A0A931ANB7_9FIRM|nr:aminotransferase class V-fold PLP-dependent enzyme [Halonatronomonas betaini]MBF8435482.1 aminotransferase class V-fold PLP-dependent enzyme [Halonatronomonas betaini]
MNMKKVGFGSKAVHLGQDFDLKTGAHNSPIYQTSTYVFDNVDDAIRFNKDQESGYTYTRFRSPSEAELSKKVALLENGEAGISLGSGLGAISTAIMTLVKGGDHIVASDVLYGCTLTLIEEILSDYGVEFTLVDTTDHDAVKAAIQPNTKIVYLETPCNPTLKITDIKRVSEIAHEHGAKVLVDSTFASPYIQNPLDLGADVVIHSATKYLSGHGNVVAGVVVGSKEFIRKVRMPHLQTLGAVISPFDAWVVMQGMKTLELRMERHCENGMKVAEYLNDHPAVEKVYYPGLPEHPQHELAKKQMNGFGGMISFDLKGGFEAGKALMNSVDMISIATSLGNVDTLIQHSPSMSHFDMTPEERAAVGINEGQVRLSVGVENVEDIISDLDSALDLMEKKIK